MPNVDLAAAHARIRPSGPADIDAVRRCLVACDLTVAGLGVSDLRLWVLENRSGQTVGVTGFEIAGIHALIRSVAVAPDLRKNGLGALLAEFAFEQASAAGATQFWLFSSRSGAFWQRLGFRLTTTDELAAAAPHTWQVTSFVESGQINREIAWTRAAVVASPA